MKTTSNSLLTSLVATASLIASGCEALSSDEATETPTPEPTPTATPAPLVTAYRVDELKLLSAGTGLDLDDDGIPDNGFETVLESIVVLTTDAISANLIEAGADPAKVQLVAGNVNAVLSQSLDLSNINRSFDLAIDNFRTNLVLELSQRSDGDADLSWFQAELTAKGLSFDAENPGQLMGIQRGFFEPDGLLRLEGDLELNTLTGLTNDYYVDEVLSGMTWEDYWMDAFADAMGDAFDSIGWALCDAFCWYGDCGCDSYYTDDDGSYDGQEYSISLYAARTEVPVVYPEQVNNVRFGGVILESDLERVIGAMAADMIASFAYPQYIDEARSDAILEQVYAGMHEVADFELEGAPAFSIGFELDGIAAAVAPK